MARLETQINQIYITHPEAKKNSLLLYEEQLTPSLQLFVVAELWNLQKKSEGGDLKRISEIILSSFRANKKLPAETLFETSLSQINQNLADLAHEGRKSWVGKFSCLICIKGLDNNIYAANNGQTSAWLKRKSELMEILPAEKRGTHPLKTFMNFTQGKLTDTDTLVLTTSNIFSYVSFELFSKLLDRLPAEQASEEISKILRDSMTADVAFSSFILHFSRKAFEEPVAQPKPETNIYSPIPEDEYAPLVPQTSPSFKLPKLPSLSFGFLRKIKLPAVNWAWLQKIKIPAYFQNLSTAGKFFFISFSLFLLLFLINLAFFASRINDRKEQGRIEQLVEKINNDIAQTQSSLIYKDENEAVRQLAQTLIDMEELNRLSPELASELNAKVEQVKTVVNKINIINDPSVFLELKHNPIYVTPSTIGVLFSNEDSNSLSVYKNELSDYFLLNSLKNPITSISYFSPAGVVIAAGTEIQRINQTLKQFDSVLNLGIDIKKIKAANNALYALTNDKVSRINFTGGQYRVQTSITGDFTNARDLGIDKDIYLLYPDKIVKYVSGQAQSFPLPNMSDPLTNGDKIFVGSNLYILEGNKKRLIVINKNGALINQIYFPTTSALTDFYVEEASRSIYLLEDNKLLKITF